MYGYRTLIYPCTETAENILKGRRKFRQLAPQEVLLSRGQLNKCCTHLISFCRPVGMPWKGRDILSDSRRVPLSTFALYYRSVHDACVCASFFEDADVCIAFHTKIIRGSSGFAIVLMPGISARGWRHFCGFGYYNEFGSGSNLNAFVLFEKRKKKNSAHMHRRCEFLRLWRNSWLNMTIG